MGFQADEMFDLFNGPLRFSPRQIDLIDHRNQLEVIFDREIGIGQRLRFDTLRSIDDK